MFANNAIASILGPFVITSAHGVMRSAAFVLFVDMFVYEQNR